MHYIGCVMYPVCIISNIRYALHRLCNVSCVY